MPPLEENKLYKAALWYAKNKGWPVIALHCPANNSCTCQRGAMCSTSGKHPRYDKKLLQHGLKSATTDPEIIKRWWLMWPDANVGIATGKNSFDVLDVDLKGNGDDTLAELERAHGKVPDTIEQITGSGGRQIMFRPTGAIANEVRFASGLDTRSDGGLVVVPPSLHSCGRLYAWEESSRPDDNVQLADMPIWLLQVIGEKQVGGNGTGVDTAAVWSGIEEGERDQSIFRYACQLRARNLEYAEAWVIIQSVAAFCKPPFPDKDAKRKLDQAWKYAPGKSFEQQLEESYGASGASGASGAEDANETAWCKHGASMVQDFYGNETIDIEEKSSNRKQHAPIVPKLSDSDKVRKWLELSDGVFHYTEVARDLQINLHILRNILARFAKDEKTIERVGTKSGTYQKIEKNFVRTELFKSRGEEFEIILPLGLSSLVKLYPGSLTVIAGDSNAAKTALLMEIARLNLHDQTIRYINSEMPDDELDARLMKFAPVMDLDLWHRVEFGRIPKNYHHHVLRDCITIIDFIDIHEEFFRIGEILKSIHEKIGSGLCFVSLQKSRGAMLGKGGNITLEKSRLYIAIDLVSQPDSAPHNRARIEKCKGFRDDSINPNGMVRNFNVNKWVFISPMDEWHYGNKHERIQPRTQ